MPVPLIDVQAQQASSPLLSASPGLMIWTLVMFFITLYILKTKVFGPIGAIVEKRRAEIAQSIDEAERSRDEANAMLDDYKQQLAEARKEADQLREQGRKEGERQGAQLVTAAQQQRDRVLADTEQQVVAQTRQAASGLRDDVVQLALNAAEKVSGKALTEADHRRLIEEAIDGADLSVLKGAGASA
ncbi:MAG: F0F1 ATP synthase subunit B [Thermoleophilia bacterium]